MTQASPSNADREGDSILDSRRSWYVLALLMLSYSLSYIDRQMLNLLVDPIKSSLLISDTQFSLVQGIGFVAAYMLATPVFGRLVDLTNRRNILMFGVCTWSICTALAGGASTYFELLLTRFGVGVSEACIFPVCWSLIADYFSERRAPRAMSVLLLGPQLGGGFSLVASGLVIGFAADLKSHIPAFASLQTWQMAFVVIGLPGVLYAMFLLTLREPRRRKILVTDVADEAPTAREVAQSLWARRGFYVRIWLAIGTIGVVQLGVPAWFPSFMIRAHAMSPAETGYKLGVLSVIVGSAGTLLGPAVSRWCERRGYADAPLRVSSFATIGLFASCVAIPLLPGDAGALTAAAGAFFFTGLPVGIIAAATQRATAARMQGVVASIYTFTAQLIGYGVGPSAIALFTDRVFANPQMVGYSLEIVTSTASAIAALLLFSVLREYRRMLTEVAGQRDKEAVESLESQSRPELSQR